jgi:hypothetical protein
LSCKISEKKVITNGDSKVCGYCLLLLERVEDGVEYGGEKKNER